MPRSIAYLERFRGIARSCSCLPKRAATRKSRAAVMRKIGAGSIADVVRYAVRMRIVTV
jgi:FixJ family two-component response regulator